MSEKGFVYIMTNQAMPGLLKIGRTSKLPEKRENRYPKLELVRLALPRRTYTDNHIRYIAAALKNVFDRRDEITKGYKITWESEILRHFTVKLEQA